jgi:uncharacterized RDD family membrane protein YckC
MSVVPFIPLTKFLLLATVTPRSAYIHMYIAKTHVVFAIQTVYSKWINDGGMKNIERENFVYRDGPT